MKRIPALSDDVMTCRRVQETQDVPDSRDSIFAARQDYEESVSQSIVVKTDHY
jgi:hypothetical protein